jgi:hypothetical protein
MVKKNIISTTTYVSNVGVHTIRFCRSLTHAHGSSRQHPSPPPQISPLADLMPTPALPPPALPLFPRRLAADLDPANLALATTAHAPTRDGSSPPCPSHHNRAAPSPAEPETSELAVEAMPLGDGAEVADFMLPDELLVALTRDPYKQLDLTCRITALAVSGRVSGLERETGRLRAEAAGKDRENTELRERVVLLDTALQETNARLHPPMLTMADLPTGTRDLAREFRFPPGWFLEGSKVCWVGAFPSAFCFVFLGRGGMLGQRIDLDRRGSPVYNKLDPHSTGLCQSPCPPPLPLVFLSSSLSVSGPHLQRAFR